MTEYKRSISLSETLGCKDKQRFRGLKCHKLHLKLSNNFRKVFLNVKLQRLWRSHHLQYIIFFKNSVHQDERLHSRDKAEGQNWMLVIFFDLIKVKMSLYFPWNGAMSQFQHLISPLCSIGNKIWVYENCKSSYSIFIYVLHSIPTFLDLEL